MEIWYNNIIRVISNLIIKPTKNKLKLKLMQAICTNFN